ncbi:MAG TPA: hypothetical protein DCZ11_08220, partial [Gammaproteobacteria bacterium]|nr:hypothetical protein [Gammaproteobacteria bacterium]MCH78414.1 hypothetical protein [Gammaproteobacteria bacterium]
MADLRAGGVYPVRLPFAGEGTGRDAAFTKDRYYKNLFIEQWSDKQVIVKRPGLQTLEDGGDVCHDGLPGLGLYNWEGILISVFGSTIYSETIGAPVVWTQVANAPAQLRQSYGVAQGDYFFVFGGETPSGMSSAVYRYNKTTDTWDNPTSIPYGAYRELVAAPLPNGEIYVAGGRTASAETNKAYWYNPTTNTWQQKNNLPSSWHDMRVITLSNGKMMICGGNYWSSVTKDVYLYDYQADSYTALADMNVARSNFALVELTDGRVMAIAGKIDPGGVGNTTQTCEIYNPATDTWTLVTNYPLATQYHSAAADASGHVYVWGGKINGTATNAIYAYSVEMDSWSQLVNFPISVGASSYGRFDDGIYINATGENASILNATYVTDTGTPTVQCTSLGSIIAGEPGVSFAEIFTDSKKLLIKTSDKLYVVDRATLGLTTVSDVDYPAATVPGVVTLDGYTFVMDADGTIYNSDLEDPTAWDSLNFINAEIEADDGVALA